MAPTRTSTDHLIPLVLVLVTGAALWYAHAQSWDLGGRSPILSYESAQVALAARELVWHGKVATPYALPIDLASHAHPPWPLSSVQPGMMFVEALILKLVPARGITAGSDSRAWLTLVMPFICYLVFGAFTVLAANYVLARHARESPRWVRMGAPAALGLAAILDAQAQHFALSGVGELPATVLLLLALLGLALGAGTSIPLTLGFVLGVSGLFRANAVWLAPVFALAAAWSAPVGRRRYCGALVLAGFVLPLAPWWIYKWRAFGSPAWDMAWFELWDHVQGRSWFELLHRAEIPELPRGFEALGLLAGKSAANLARLVPPLLSGPRGLWLGALACWPFTRSSADESSRPLIAAAVVAFACLVLDTLAASASSPLLREVFPTRALAELSGMLALWSLLGRIPGSSARTRAVAGVIAAVLALGWGAWMTVAAQTESRAMSLERGLPSSRSLTALSASLNSVLVPGEVLMSNLGPALAWQTNHPVIHLAYSPADIPSCRARHDFRHVLLVFRSAERAWAPWQDIVELPGEAGTHAELGVRRERRFTTEDGFAVVWLELGPRTPQVALLRP
ncbi:MAG TPA: hypothetical protein VN896_00510 [Methylomirabilota bacterium]|jgi:hypothetical protein|nr:hypothetical protein [Methylomirabilota bacterium]